MKNTKVLEMLNEGKIEELKKQLEDEIFVENLKGGNAKKRHAAMKRYFKYVSEFDKEMGKYPCKNVMVENQVYSSFLDGMCFALTMEDIGDMETFDTSKADYFSYSRIIDFSKVLSVEKININSVIARATSKGYKYKKQEFKNPNYLFKYKESYFNMVLLDKCYGIIDDGNEVEVHYSGKFGLLLIKNDIGIAGILPIRYNKNRMKHCVIIEIS